MSYMTYNGLYMYGEDTPNSLVSMVYTRYMYMYVTLLYPLHNSLDQDDKY